MNADPVAQELADDLRSNVMIVVSGDDRQRTKMGHVDVRAEQLFQPTEDTRDAVRRRPHGGQLVAAARPALRSGSLRVHSTDKQGNRDISHMLMLSRRSLATLV